ncbi:MAG: glycosyltransferase family 4 protein [Planctomycetota bacterium]
MATSEDSMGRIRKIVSRPLRISIVTPAERGSRAGNRVTALRWAGLLRELGHRPRLATTWRGQPCDVLVTVHAVKSAQAAIDARRARPDLAIVTLLSGTDIYPKFAPDARTAEALRCADALLALQPLALDVLPTDLRERARPMIQSATAVDAPRDPGFSACLLAHLRPVKNPLLAVRAVAALPQRLACTLAIAGERLDPDYGDEVERAAATDERVRLVGALDRRDSKRLLARSTVCLVPSRAEGGANVVSEAIAAGTPVLCSAIPGNLGLLGDDWPGTFTDDDVDACAALLERTATDRAFLDDLCARTRALQPMVCPAAEREAWRVLLADLGVG